MFSSLGNSIPTDFARRYLFDGSGNSTTGSNNATVTNGTWVKSERMYQNQCLSWGAYTTCTYTSVTYTNSYIWIYASGVWTFTKNSSKVTATALNGVNGERYAGLTFFNRTLTSDEEQILQLEGRKLLGPTNIAKYPKLFEGLTAYYDFRGDVQNIVDGTFNGTLVNSPTLTTDLFGNSKGYNFVRASAQHINGVKKLDDSLNNRTINFLINNDNNPGGNDLSLYTQWTSGLPYVLMGLHSNNKFWFYNGVSGAEGTITCSGVNLITVTKSSTTYRIYVNGVLDISGTVSTSNPGSTLNTQIANRPDVSGYSYQGKIYEVTMFNRPLSADEVKLLYNLTSQDYIYPTPNYSLTNLQDGLLIHLNGTNNGTTTLYDISGNGINGTASSTPTYKRQGRIKTISLSSQSISWTSTSFTTSTCFEKVSGKWTLQVNPAYITTTGVSSGTREITDIRLYNRTLTTIEQEQLKYSKIGNFIY